MKNKVIHGTHVGDFEHFHVFHIEGQGLSGTIYAPHEKLIPRTLTVHMRSKQEADVDHKKR